MMKVNILLIACVALFLHGCGFSPAYGPKSTRAVFDDIYIRQIADRSGQVLRNELIDRLHGSRHVLDGRYHLVVDQIEESRRNFDITEGADTTRTQLRLVTDFRLIDAQENKILLERNITAFGSYNILDSQFTTKVSRDRARENGLTDLARQIERDLLLNIELLKK